MKLLNNYGTNPNKKVYEETMRLDILTRVHLECKSHLCGSCRFAKPDSTGGCLVHIARNIPASWKLPKKLELTDKPIPDPGLSEVLDSIKSLSSKERWRYQI